MRKVSHPRTHIETLADPTPKSRRRVRALCRMAPQVSVDNEDVDSAQHFARRNERAEAARVALVKQSRMHPSLAGVSS